MSTSIVIVDDHEAFRTFARRLLEAGGLEIAGEAGDGASAVALVERIDPDAVLLDIQLPDIDGFEVARRLAASRSRIVFTSTRGVEDYGDRLGAAGAAGFIPKHDLSAAAMLDLLGVP